MVYNDMQRGSWRPALEKGGWNPVLRKQSRIDLGARQSENRWITIFIDDIPENMGQNELKKLFSKFGVVMDAFIPRKRSKAGKHFGFIRYNCSVAAEMAIQKANGLWVHNKQLKVKVADFERNQRNKTTTVNKRVSSMWVPKQANHRREATGHIKPSDVREALAKEVKNRVTSQEVLPEVRGVCSGNGWLYRSAVAIFGDHRTTDVLLESFINQERSDVTVRRLGNKKILVTFPSEERMKIEEDTLKCIRCDIGKVKIVTKSHSTINQLMKGEGEQTRPDSANEEGDDVEGDIDDRASANGEDGMQTLITKTLEDTIGNKDFEGNTSNLVEEEMRGFMLTADGGMNHHRFLEPGDTGVIERVWGELVAYNSAQQPLGNASGPIFNMKGINSEVVLSPTVGPSKDGLNSTGLDLVAQHSLWDNNNNVARAGRMGEAGVAQFPENTGPSLHYQGNCSRRSQGADFTEHIIEEGVVVKKRTRGRPPK
ncbi:hypothetical protein Dimus_008740 [Dionaea muscipula]